MDQQHQHVEPLPDDLKTYFHPIHFSKLEELCASEGFEKTPLFLAFWFSFVEFVQDPVF